MAAGWSADIGSAGGALTNYPDALPVKFHSRHNALGYFTVVLPQLGGLAAPTREMVIRIVWDKSLATEQVHFEGVILDVRRHDRTNTYHLTGIDVAGLTWFMGSADNAGASRKWTTQTPHTILTSAGTPRGLVYNTQNALRPIGATTLQYGSAAAVPNKVDGANPGTAIDFLADGGRTLVNLQRLCLQARYDGASYGLEFFGRLEGANNSDPKLYVVKRRERAAAYTPEVWEVNESLFNARRGHEGMTAAEALRAVGIGDGTSRVQSGLYGSGGMEGIVADKSIIGTTNATNMVNRLGELLNPTTEVVTGYVLKHGMATRVGDTVTIRESGKADVNLRVFEIHYVLEQRAFRVMLGRPRPMSEDPLVKLDILAGGQAHASQVTDAVPVTIKGTGHTASLAAPVTVNPGTQGTLISAALAPALSAFGRAEHFLVNVDLMVQTAPDPTVDSHTHSYDKTTSISVNNSDSGNAGADPHTHVAFPNHTSTASGATAPGILVQGPYIMTLDVGDNTGVWRQVAAWTIPALRPDAVETYPFGGNYPFAIDDSSGSAYEVTHFRLKLRNMGEVPITFGLPTTATLNRVALHQHNALS